MKASVFFISIAMELISFHAYAGNDPHVIQNQNSPMSEIDALLAELDGIPQQESSLLSPKMSMRQNF